MHDASLREIVSLLDTELRVAEVPDYGGAVNGLQVANDGTVRVVATAVDASRATIAEAERVEADLLIVHHGLFWSGAQPLVGIAYDKYRTLFARNIAVYASHLPLDLHPTLGNNARLANALGLEPSGGFARYKSIDVGVRGTCDESSASLVARVRDVVAPYGGVVRTSVEPGDRRTRRWAICSGGGASTESLREAREYGIDTLIVGEGAHHTMVEAMEHDLLVVYAGHYATETLGVQALGALLAERFGVRHHFLNVPTGS